MQLPDGYEGGEDGVVDVLLGGRQADRTILGLG